MSPPWPPEIELARSLARLEAGVDHVRGPDSAPVILEYGDYECPYSRQAFRAIEHVERSLRGEVRFAFRHFPLGEIHPHAFAAAMAAEAAARQGRFWEMHERLFHRQDALEDDDLAHTGSRSGSTCPASSATVVGAKHVPGSAATVQAERQPAR